MVHIAERANGGTKSAVKGAKPIKEICFGENVIKQNAVWKRDWNTAEKSERSLFIYK